MRAVELEDDRTYKITGREGVVVTTYMADPPYLVGEHLTVDGKRHVVRGIESHPLPDDAGLAPGARVGLLVVPMGELR